jgi:hypothetical protein
MAIRHRRTHEAPQDGQPHSSGSYSEEELENDENDFGSTGELSSPEEPMHPASMGISAMNVPAPSTLVGISHHYNQPPPSQMVHPQMLQQQM